MNINEFAYIVLICLVSCILLIADIISLYYMIIAIKNKNIRLSVILSGMILIFTSIILAIVLLLII